MSLTNNIVAYWKFEGNSNDSVGGNNGTDTSVTYNTSNGKILQGAGFNGTSSGITTTWSSVPTNTISIFGWVYLDSLASCRFFGWGDSASGTSAFQPIFNLLADNKIFWAIRDSAGNASDIAGSIALTTGQWYHIGCVGSSASGYTSYVNNSVDGTNGTGRTLGARNFAIGRATNPSGWVNGRIDELGVWDRVLTGPEINQLYNGGAGLTYPFSAGVNSGFFNFF